MPRNLKRLVSCLAAVTAIGGLSAGAAQAATPEFHCTATKTANCQLTSSGSKGGSNDHVITVEGGQVKCTGNAGTDGALFPGTVAKTSTTLTLSATYVGCSVFGKSATIKMEECKYVFHLIEGGASPYPTLTDISCPGTNKITITPSGLSCTITIGAQVGFLGTTVINEGGTEPTNIKLETNLAGLAYTLTGTECPKKAGSFTNGTYTGTSRENGYEDEEEGKKEGPKVGLHVF